MFLCKQKLGQFITKRSTAEEILREVIHAEGK